MPDIVLKALLRAVLCERIGRFLISKRFDMYITAIPDLSAAFILGRCFNITNFWRFLVLFGPQFKCNQGK